MLDKLHLKRQCSWVNMNQGDIRFLLCDIYEIQNGRNFIFLNFLTEENLIINET